MYFFIKVNCNNNFAAKKQNTLHPIMKKSEGKNMKTQFFPCSIELIVIFMTGLSQMSEMLRSKIKDRKQLRISWTVNSDDLIQMTFNLMFFVTEE